MTSKLSEELRIDSSEVEQQQQPNQLPILSAIHESENMEEPELDFSGNDDEDHLGVEMEDDGDVASGRCSTLPPPIKERGSINRNVNNSANLTAALHAVNNHHNSIKTGPAWSNRPPLSQVDTQKPATEVRSSN